MRSLSSMTTTSGLPESTASSSLSRIPVCWGWQSIHWNSCSSLENRSGEGELSNRTLSPPHFLLLIMREHRFIILGSEPDCYAVCSVVKPSPGCFCSETSFRSQHVYSSKKLTPKSGPVLQLWYSAISLRRTGTLVGQGVSQSQLTLPSDFQLLIKGQSPKKCLISPYWKQRTASSVVEGGGSPTCSFPWEPSPIHRSGASSAVFGFLSQAKRPASASSIPQLKFSIALVWISGNWGKACRFPCERYKNWEC